MIGNNVFLAEFIGTMMLIIFGNGVVAGCVLKKSKSENSGWIVITAGWGFAVMMAAYATGWISGAHLNPALTIGLASAGMFPANLVVGYVVAQMLGAMFGQLIVYLIYKVHYDVTEDQGAILATHCTGPAIRDFKWNFVTEALVTAILVFGLSAVGHVNNRTVEFAAEGGKILGQIGIVGPMIAGFYIWAVGLSLGGPTGYAINPARDLGPRLMHAILPIKNKGGNDWEYAWVPVVGPIVGAVVGALVYRGLFI